MVYTHVQRDREDLCIILYQMWKAGHTAIHNSTENDTFIFNKRRTKGVMIWHFQVAPVKQNLTNSTVSAQTLCHDRVNTFALYCLTTGTQTKVQDVLASVYIYLLKTRN